MTIGGCRDAPRGGYNCAMRRLTGPVAAAWLAIVLALSLAPAAIADERDPRCDAWALSGPPPGIDMAASCPSTTLGVTTADVALDNEPLVPYIVGLLVMAAVLVAFGFIAMRVMARPGGGRRSDPWWNCPACGSSNQSRRSTCFACQASRAAPAPTHPA